MKKLLLIILFFFIAGMSFAQTIGDTDTPYATNGWDAPEDSTAHYQLPIYRLLSNPGGWINKSQRKVDSLLYALIVYTDRKQLYIRNDTLVVSDTLSFHGQFTTTAQYDTTQVLGVDSLDCFIATPRESVPTSNDVLSVKAWADTVVVQRPASGTSGLKYDCIWIRKYQ